MSDHGTIDPGTSGSQAAVPAAAQPGTSSIGTSSTALMGAIDGVRRMVVTVLALVILVGVVLGGMLLVTRNELAAANDRIGALAVLAQAAQQPQQQGSADQQAPSVSPATALEGVERLPSGADASGGLLIGNPDAATVVEVFVDFQCPFCQRWEGEFGQELVAKASAPDSDLLVKLYPLAFLKETDVLASPGASARASNAAACIADTEDTAVLNTFTSTVYAAADPSEPDGQFPTAQLVEFATTSGAGPEAIACIQEQPFLPYVQAVTQGAFARGVSGTPTVVINGEAASNPFTDERLTALLNG